MGLAVLRTERAGDLPEALASKRSFSSYFKIISAFIVSPIISRKNVAVNETKTYEEAIARPGTFGRVEGIERLIELSDSPRVENSACMVVAKMIQRSHVCESRQIAMHGKARLFSVLPFLFKGS